MRGKCPLCDFICTGTNHDVSNEIVCHCQEFHKKKRAWTEANAPDPHQIICPDCAAKGLSKAALALVTCYKQHPPGPAKIPKIDNLMRLLKKAADRYEDVTK